MDLIIWRHAEAEDPREGLDELQRALTTRGEKQAARMAKWLDLCLPDSQGVASRYPNSSCRSRSTTSHRSTCKSARCISAAAIRRRAWLSAFASDIADTVTVINICPSGPATNVGHKSGSPSSMLSPARSRFGPVTHNFTR